MSTKILRSRTGSVLAALGLIALGVAGPASAAPVNLVDPEATGSITVHKFERPTDPTGLPANGTEVDTTGLSPIAGVEFTVQKVQTLDLGTNAGWAAASDLSGAFDPADPTGSITGAGYTLASNGVEVTATDGTAVFTDLPVGLYLVTESSYPAGITPSAPFLVTLPLTDPSSTDNWLYDVHVYPKNSLTTATKTVKESESVKIGDPVVWTIRADIPNEEIIDGYRIVDALDSKLDYVSAQVSLVDGTAITEGTDYTITFDQATNTVTVEFTPAGRAILAAHNATQVQVVVNTSVNAIGEIENEAVVYPNLPSFDIEPGEPGGPTVTPPVETKWGELTVAKVDENGDQLAGAVFSVYASEADAKAGTNPIELGGQTQFTIAADGTLTLSGLRYSDFADGKTLAPSDPEFRAYWLAEVKAPAGYELLAEPISFLINAATTAVGVDLTVENVPHNGGFELPITGGSGTTAIYIAGALILAGSVVLVLRARRREPATR
ncbi:SpaH/EbpB family LPXTG-anchored major pilin [Cellulosimicrobium cellulans]|uniref:SpaH/EbpB family LPXTG-anchored major pilin n=1 Tax=Cellulosimicrobium cellulans TaxID=1710 RepID=UPI0036E1E0F3